MFDPRHIDQKGYKLFSKKNAKGHIINPQKFAADATFAVKAANSSWTYWAFGEDQKTIYELTIEPKKPGEDSGHFITRVLKTSLPAEYSNKADLTIVTGFTSSYIFILGMGNEERGIECGALNITSQEGQYEPIKASLKPYIGGPTKAHAVGKMILYISTNGIQWMDLEKAHVGWKMVEGEGVKKIGIPNFLIPVDENSFMIAQSAETG